MYVYSRRRPRKCATNATREPTCSGGGVLHSTDPMLAYQASALSGLTSSEQRPRQACRSRPYSTLQRSWRSGSAAGCGTRMHTRSRADRSAGARPAPRRSGKAAGRRPTRNRVAAPRCERGVHLLQIRRVAARALRLTAASHERLELVAAVAAGVFEHRHTDPSNSVHLRIQKGGVGLHPRSPVPDSQIQAGGENIAK